MKGIVLCDVDGTLADMGKGKPGRRGPYDWGRVDEDDPIMPIIDLVKTLYEAGHDVVFISGRMEQARRKTERWLMYMGLGHVVLYMRADGDRRPDTVIKAEIYEKWIIPLGTVAFVLDDRDSVVKMWRDLGLVCLQVAPGDF